MALVPPLFWAASLWFSQAHEASFLSLTVEDGWIENGQVVLFLLAGLLSAAISRMLRRAHRTGWAVLYGVFALALVWVAGEEISWGQRFFVFQTPGWFRIRNVQGEANLHNIDAVSKLLDVVVQYALIGLSCLSGILWKLGEARKRRWAIRLWVPHPMLVPSWLCALSYSLLRRWYLWRNPDERHVSLVVSRLQEPRELIVAAAIAVFLWFLRRTLARGNC